MSYLVFVCDGVAFAIKHTCNRMPWRSRTLLACERGQFDLRSTWIMILILTSAQHNPCHQRCWACWAVAKHCARSSSAAPSAVSQMVSVESPELDTRDIPKERTTDRRSAPPCWASFGQKHSCPFHWQWTSSNIAKYIGISISVWWHGSSKSIPSIASKSDGISWGQLESPPTATGDQKRQDWWVESIGVMMFVLILLQCFAHFLQVPIWFPSHTYLGPFFYSS